jgi:hypothetical protein
MLAGNRYAHGNDWARGFMRGTLMRHDGWAAAALAGFLMFTGVPRLLADNDDCQRRVVRADHRHCRNPAMGDTSFRVRTREPKNAQSQTHQTVG